MFKKIFCLISFILVKNSSSLTCYTQQDVSVSKTLFTYQGNVYDITGYKHPSGQNDLLKTVGVTLEEWMDKPKYKFHYSKSSFYRDLDKMLVGPLSTSCDEQVPSSVPSSVPSTSFRNTITTQTKPTSTKEIAIIKPIPNNSPNKIENFTLFSFITLLFAYLQS